MKMKENRWHYYSLLFFAMLSFLLFTTEVKAASPALSADKVKIGRTIFVKNAGKGAVYKSEDPSIAYVTQEGNIIGKKKGKTIIIVKKKGSKQSSKLPVTVVANGKLPAIPVCYEEVSLTKEKITENKEEKNASYTATVKNISKKGNIRKIEYIFNVTILEEIEDSNTSSDNNDKEENTLNTAAPDQSAENDPETEQVESNGAEDNQNSETEEPKVTYKELNKKVTLKAANIAAGKEKEIRFDGLAPNTEVKLLKVKVYSGQALVIFNYETKKFSITWGTEDKTAPVISGFVGKDSYNRDDVFMVAYPDKKYSFTKYVKATDDRDSKVTLKVDTSQINWKKSGIYNVIYSAADMAGNTSKASAKVQVRTVGQLEKMADSVLKRIVKDSWSDTKKAKAIYNYVRRNYGYVDNNDHASWEKSAMRGLKYKSGNCFMYYSVAKLLLTRCNIPNAEIKRKNSPPNHWWNLVYVQDGWYHFDTTPRRIKAVLCLLTDAQLKAYSDSAYNSHYYDSKIYPKRAEKVIQKLIRGRNTF